MEKAGWFLSALLALFLRVYGSIQVPQIIVSGGVGGGPGLGGAGTVGWGNAGFRRPGSAGEKGTDGNNGRSVLLSTPW